MGDDFWKYGLPALMAFLGVAVTKLLEIFAQRRKQQSKDIADGGQHKVQIDELAYNHMKYIVEQYQADVKALRAEVTELREQVVERDRKIETLELQVANLQSQGKEQNMTIATLRAELDMLKGTAG